MQRLNGIQATMREPQGPDDTPEKLEEEQRLAQEFIDTGWSVPQSHRSTSHTSSAEPLTEAEMAQKDAYAEEGFSDWNKRDFQQFIKALETYGW